MRAVAILHPDVPLRALDAFRLPGVELATGDGLDSAIQAEAALIFGGDGTVHRHLPDLVQMQSPVLVIPRGSGNDFARALGLSTPAASLHAWQAFCAGAGNIRRIDLGCIEHAGVPATGNSKPGNLFCCVAGAGLDADTNRRANALPRWLRGRGGYVLALVAAVAEYRPQIMHIRGDTPVSGAAMMVAIANAPAYGNRMRIAPQAKLDDGQLDICFVRRTGKLRLMRLFPHVYSGTHVGLAEVEYFQSARVRLETQTPVEIYADGEAAGRTPAEFFVLPSALPVIVPLHCVPEIRSTSRC